jgi:hypothetical protein
MQLLMGLLRAVTVGSNSRRTSVHILLSHLRLPHLGGQVPVFVSPRDRVAQLYPRALGSLFFASYDSQSYGGGILNRIHTGQIEGLLDTSFYVWSVSSCASRYRKAVPRQQRIVRGVVFYAVCVVSEGN